MDKRREQTKKETKEKMKTETLEKIWPHRHKIILGGFGVGILVVVGILPATTSLFNLEENTKWVYSVALAAAAYVYYLFNMQYIQKTPSQQQAQVPPMVQPTPQSPQRSQPTPQSPQMPAPQQAPRPKIVEKVEQQIKNSDAKLEVFNDELPPVE